VIELGIVIEVSAKHPAKHSSPIETTEFGIDIDDNEEQREKPFHPIEVTDLGITNIWSFLQLLKHRSEINSTLSQISNVRMFRFKIFSFPFATFQSTDIGKILTVEFSL
jgi:hypothetical protein